MPKDNTSLKTEIKITLGKQKQKRNSLQQNQKTTLSLSVLSFKNVRRIWQLVSYCYCFGYC